MKLKLLIYVTQIFIALSLCNSLLGQTIKNSINTPVFVENKGQWGNEVRYLAKLNGVHCWLTDNGAVYDFYKKEKVNLSTFDRLGIGYNSLTPQFNNELTGKEETSIIGQVIKMEFAGSKNIPQFIPWVKQNISYNYFSGKDSSKYAVNVPSYQEVAVKHIYPGVDYRYYFDYNRLRYDITLAPGADLSQIKMYFTGQDSLYVNASGDLLLQTCLGKIEQVDIFSYQNIEGISKRINCKFKIIQNSIVTFQTEDYDKDYTLVIDPLIYSTYMGGDDEDEGHAIVTDSSGNAFVTGYIGTTDYPSTVGAYQESYAGGDYDCFVAKINTNGNSASFFTFLGGDTTDFGYGIALDKEGNIFVTGYTSSKNFPITSGAFQRNYAGGTYDCFVTKMNSSGSALIYSTFIGGGGDDFAKGIALDTSDNAYIAGYTNSEDYPDTKFGIINVNNGVGFNCFVTKLNPLGNGLVYSTVFGGSSSDFAFGIALDSNNNAYISGKTESLDYPVTDNCFQKQFGGGTYDCFVTKVNSIGSKLDYSTFVGSEGDDWSTSIAVDKSGNAYITGNTNSIKFPTTNNAFQKSVLGEGFDCFATKLAPDGKGIKYSTFLGGTKSDNANSIVIDSSGNTFIAGETGSEDFPITKDACQPQFGKGPFDCFITKLNEDASSVFYSTFLGSSENSWVNSITLDLRKNVYITGETNCKDFPISNKAMQNNFGGDWDCFITKISIDDINSTSDVSVKNKSAIICYPNPFQDYVNINYSVSLPTHVSIKIYNILGMLIKNIADKFIEAGYYNFIWRPMEQNLVDGIYYCEYVARENRQILPVVYFK